MSDAPSRFPNGTESLTLAIGMRREMQDAIDCEDYERAGSLRDDLLAIDERARGSHDAARDVPAESPSSRSPEAGKAPGSEDDTANGGSGASGNATGS